MKTVKFGVLLIISLSLDCLFTACEKKQDYSDVVFKNYLGYEINRASTQLNTTLEGSEEGDYREGSKQSYQHAIDDATLVYGDDASSQELIDQAYKDLLQAGEDYFDQMVPFRTEFQDLVYYAEITLNNTEEGDQEGNVKPGSKQTLQNAIAEANQTLMRNDLTQRILDDATVALTQAIYDFNKAIVGRGLVVIENPGFESPGYSTTDFNSVNGWNVFGIQESWAPLASISEEETVPEGQFVAKIGSYTQGLYQQLYERLHPNADYELTFRVAVLSNNTDWQGKRYKVIILSRIISFEKEPGNYDFAEVITESYDTLGINPTGYIELKQSFTIDATSTLVGKKIAVDFLQRHTWNTEEPIWAESFVGIDDVRLYRKLK